MIYEVIDRETISSLTDSVGFTAAKLVSRKVYAIIQAVDGNVRFTIDGTTPSTSLGLRLTQDSSVEVWGSDTMTNFRCIDDGGTAKLEVVYMGKGGS